MGVHVFLRDISSFLFLCFAVEELGCRAVELTSSLHKELLIEGFTVGAHVWAVLACLNCGHTIVSQVTNPLGEIVER